MLSKNGKRDNDIINICVYINMKFIYIHLVLDYYEILNMKDL